MSSQLLKINQDIIIYDDTAIDEADENLFDTKYWQAQRQSEIVSKGRGEILLININGQPAVLKHYHRGGLIANALLDKYLWIGLESSRSFAEYKILRTMYKLNLPVPRPIAARVNKQGLFYQADLITSQIIGANSMAGLLLKQRLTPQHWLDIGDCIGRFHQLGFYHDDLNIENIMIDHEENVFLLDFDKGVQSQADKNYSTRSFDRMKRSVMKWCSLNNQPFPGTEWEQLMVGHSLRTGQD